MPVISHSELFTRWIRRADELEAGGELAPACRHLLECPWRCDLSREYAYRAGRVFGWLSVEAEESRALCAAEPDVAMGVLRRAEALTFLDARELGRAARMDARAFTGLLTDGTFPMTRLRRPFFLGLGTRVHGDALGVDAEREVALLHGRHDCARCPCAATEGFRPGARAGAPQRAPG